MTDTVNVAVIGGGIMGVAALYELANHGCTDCVLYEKAELTSGSTWHAAGQIAHAVGGRLSGWINKTSIATYKAVEKETGQSIGWHEVGGYRVAYDDDEVDWLKSIMGVGRLLDFPMQLVGPEDVARGNPFYNTAGIKAAVQTFADGHIDPSGVTMALASAARSRGGRIERHNRVTGATRKGVLWHLTTEKGDVLAEQVVIAAGSYANQVGSWFGLKIPSVSCLHHYLVTDNVPEFQGRPELPVMRDNSFGGYLRQEQQSGLIGIYESHVCPTIWTMPEGAPWAAVNELFEEDFDSIGDFLTIAFGKMPLLAERGIKRVVRGAITHTPDGGMLLGPSGAPNVWLACGSSIGLAWGGGAAKILAQWITTGKTEQSTRSLDPRRYGNFADDNYIVERTREEFMHRHDTPVPGKHFHSLRPLNRHVLYDRLAAKAAVFGEVAGWERPRWFAHKPGVDDANGWRRQSWHERVGDEVRAVRQAAGVIDLCAFAQFMLTGPDAFALLERLSANRVPQSDGRIALCHLLTEHGRFESEITISRLSQDRYFTGSAIARANPDLDWLASHIQQGEDVKIENLTEQWGMLALSGPASRKILTRLTDASLSNTDFPWLTAQEITLAGKSVLALRISFTGELGWEIHAPLEVIGLIYDALHDAGADFGLIDFGSHALNSMRLEKAYPASGELTTDVGMKEAHLMRFFKPENREFLGREATLAAEPGWRLVYAEVETDVDCHGGEPVLANGVVVGLTTTGAYGHSVGKSLVFAYLKADAPDAGLSVQLLNQPRALKLLDEPVYDPSSLRPRMSD